MVLLALHRVRVGQRTGVINQIRGFLIEHGTTVRRGVGGTVCPTRARVRCHILRANHHSEWLASHLFDALTRIE